MCVTLITEVSKLSYSFKNKIKLIRRNKIYTYFYNHYRKCVYNVLTSTTQYVDLKSAQCDCFCYFTGVFSLLFLFCGWVYLPLILLQNAKQGVREAGLRIIKGKSQMKVSFYIWFPGEHMHFEWKGTSLFWIQ